MRYNFPNFREITINIPLNTDSSYDRNKRKRQIIKIHVMTFSNKFVIYYSD